MSNSLIMCCLEWIIRKQAQMADGVILGVKPENLAEPEMPELDVSEVSEMSMAFAKLLCEAGI